VRALLALIGAIVGVRLAGWSNWSLGLLTGGGAGLAVAELFRLARRVESLEKDVEGLTAQLAASAVPTAAAPVVAAAAPAPAAAPALAPTPTPAPAPAPTPSAARSWPTPPSARIPAAAPEVPPIVRIVRDFFSGGNALVRIGIIVLLFGVGFLLRYVSEHTRVPIQFRLSGVTAAALVLLTLGWRLRLRRPGYALALQGGAVGVLYLVVFAAMRLYALLSPAAAFPLLVVLSALTAMLAIVQNSLAFELLAIAGGFLAPILASNGQGDHVVLFTYYAVLNAVIVVTAWFKSWRALNVAGFLFTFVIATAWGVLRYRPEDLPSTEPFLILFFIFYLVIGILFSLRQPPNLRGYIDGTLIFGTPIAAFGLQSAMLYQQLLPLAFSSLAVSAVYLTFAGSLHRSGRPAQRPLVEAFLALGVAFLTLAVPLALSGSWTSASWALEGAALVWIGCRQNRLLVRIAGVLLQIAAGCTVWLSVDFLSGHFVMPEGLYLSGLTVGVASICSAQALNRHLSRLHENERPIQAALFFWGVIFWVLSGMIELRHRCPAPYLLNVELCFVAVTSLLSSQLHQRLRLDIAKIPALLLLPAMLLFALSMVSPVSHPLANGGLISWPLAFAAFYLIARRHEGASDGALAPILHSVSVWLLALLLSWELQWQVHHLVGAVGSWSGIAWAVVPALLLSLLPVLADRHRKSYRDIACMGLALYLGLWILITNFSMRGDAQPLPYIPLLNPLDLAQVFVLIVLLRYFLLIRADLLANGPVAAIVLALLSFIALNGALLRALNHLFGVPFALDAMLQSTLVQTSLSIFWAVIALTAMLIATRSARRIVWLAGAALLGIVVIKLFLVDLSRIGSIERIVSFVGVGLLMLVLGYFSPLPPEVREQR
jgi:uncharacterized membrane protein